MDVALAMVMAGVVYLTWVLACWSAKDVAVSLQSSSELQHRFPPLTMAFLNTFGSMYAVAIDVFGTLWLVASLWLVIRASRQRRIISWSWLLISAQGIAGLLFTVWAALASSLALDAATTATPIPLPNKAGWSPALVAIALLIWVATLVWLILDGSRIRRRGPGIGDSFKSHIYGR